MEKTIVGGVFKDTDRALQAIHSLKDLGFDERNISVFAKDSDDLEKIENRTGVETNEEGTDRGSNAGKGAGIGIGTGGVLGGIVGLIAEVGLLTIPGIGVLAAAGPIATTLSGAAIGATGGGLIGALTGAGIPKHQAEEYERYLKEGNVLLLAEVEKTQQEKIHHTFIDSHSINTHMYTTS